MNDYQHPEKVAPNSMRKLSKVLSHVGLKMIDMTGRNIWDNTKRYNFTIHADLKEKGKFGEKSGVFFAFDENGHPWMCQTPENDNLETAFLRSGYQLSPSSCPIDNVKNAKIDEKNIWDVLPSNKPKEQGNKEIQVVESLQSKRIVGFSEWVSMRRNRP